MTSPSTNSCGGKRCNLRTLNQTQGTEQGKISKYTTKKVQENERGKGELFKQKDAPVGQDHQASYYH